MLTDHQSGLEQIQGVSYYSSGDTRCQSVYIWSYRTSFDYSGNKFYEKQSTRIFKDAKQCKAKSKTYPATTFSNTNLLDGCTVAEMVCSVVEELPVIFGHSIYSQPGTLYSVGRRHYFCPSACWTFYPSSDRCMFVAEERSGSKAK